MANGVCSICYDLRGREIARLENYQESLELQIRAWEAAVNRMCSCGGKGPLDPGVCQACAVYHTAKRTEA